MAAIRLQGVTKSYARGAAAVRGLTLEISHGEFMVLVGPSGSGKTTTLRLLAGLESPSAGTIHFGNRDMAGVSPQDRDVAMVFQDAALYPHMSAQKNLAFPLQIRRVPKAEIRSRIDVVAKELGIASLLDRKPHQLSGGEAQRVALGKAIVRRPSLMLFDEPVSNVDPRRRVELRALILTTVRRYPATTVYVTHDHEEAMAMGDRMAVMDQGVIRQVGRPLDVYRTPADRFVAGFLGSPPMNFLEGSLAVIDGRVIFSDGASLRVDCGPSLSPTPDRAILGLRPQDLCIKTIASATTIDATVDLVLPRPDGAEIHLRTARGDVLVARLTSDDHPSPGTTMNLSVRPESAYLFETGEAGRNLKDTSRRIHS